MEVSCGAEGREASVQNGLHSDAKARYSLYIDQILIDRDELPPDRISERILPGNWKGFR